MRCVDSSAFGPLLIPQKPAPNGVGSMASNWEEQGGRVDDLPPGSVEYYRYLEQDERVLAAISETEEARLAHLRFANHYHELAIRAGDSWTVPIPS